ncbi:ATP-binding cassette sub- B member 9 [Asimina triloba]
MWTINPLALQRESIFCFLLEREGKGRKLEMKEESADSEKAGNLKSGDKHVPFHKLFSFADPLDIVLMGVGTVAAIGSGLAMPLMTVIFGELINTFGVSTGSTVIPEVTKVTLKFVYLGVGSGAASFLQVSSWMVTSERQVSRIRALYLKAILRQDIAFFDMETTTGDIIERISRDTMLIQDAMGEKVAKFIQLVSTFIGGFVVAFIKGWLLALVMVSCIPPMVLAGAAMAIFITKMSSRGLVAYSEAGNIVEQTIRSIRTVVSFTGERQAIMKYDKSLKAACSAIIQQGVATGFGVASVLFIIFSSYGLAVWYGSKLIMEKGYTGGHVINVMIAIMTGGMALGQASPSMNAFAAGRAAAYMMFETINRKSAIDAFDTTGVALEDISGEIELRDVYFRYPTRPDVQVFSGFSLHVPSSMTMALVGESGSGKSTVVSLVERFYDPQAGEVLIDGINLKKLRLSWIRKKIGLVSQEPILFMTTIRENIAYGKADATLEEIRTATELANAAKFIDKMPQGLDTLVGENGTQLSGGQKQRIAIARAILKNPKILLLDEATSALDAESERIVQEALVRIMLNRTTVVVAHRLSTVRNADRIAVVRQGTIVEQGSHLELVKDPDGAYSQLIRLQEENNEAEEIPATDPDEIISSFNDDNIGDWSMSPRSMPKISESKGSSGRGSSGHPSFSTALSQGKNLPDDDAKGGEESAKKTHHKASLKQLAYLNKPELPILFLGSIFAVINGVIYPLFGSLLASVIQIFYEPEHELRRNARFWGLMFVCLGITSIVALPVQEYLFGIAGGKLINRIRSLTFERVVHQEISWFDDPSNSSGAISARLSADASSVRRLVGDALSLLVQNLSTVTAGLVMYEEASQVVTDAVGSIRTVASFCAEQKVMDLYRKKCEAPTKKGVHMGLVSGCGFGFSNLVLFSTYALSFYAGARFVKNGEATYTEVFRAFFALTMAAIGVSQASAVASDATKANESAASIFSIIDRKSKIDSSDGKGYTLPIVNGDIEFEHVSFNYPTRPDVKIFRDLCLSIPSGKTVAIVGESGSGKSTIIALLDRFYDPDSGRILLDGMEIQKLNLQWLRQQMALVSQEPILFNDTIRANIAYGKQGEATEEEIIAAAEAANAHHFISALPNGYDTCVGERGMQLSGGQKQRVAIARAILKDPKTLLLDEATSALDAESESVVQEALDRVMVNRTTVVIAHRLSTIKGADAIAVLQNGEIAEKGRHEMLMKINDGIYASMHHQ